MVWSLHESRPLVKTEMDTWKYCAKETCDFQSHPENQSPQSSSHSCWSVFYNLFCFFSFPSTLGESGRPWSNKMTKSLVQVDIGTFEGAVCIDNFSKHLSALGTSKPNPGLLELRWRNL